MALVTAWFFISLKLVMFIWRFLICNSSSKIAFVTNKDINSVNLMPSFWNGFQLYFPFWRAFAFHLEKKNVSAPMFQKYPPGILQVLWKTFQKLKFYETKVYLFHYQSLTSSQETDSSKKRFYDRLMCFSTNPWLRSILSIT